MMNGRERFQQTMAYGQPDRVPYFEEGIRGDVLEAWREQGMPSMATVSELFPFDFREEIEPDLETRPYLKNWPENKSELAKLRRCLDPSDPDRLPEGWAETVKAKRERGDIVMMRVHRGFFQSMGVAGWDRFAELMHLLYDDPGLVHEIMDIQGELSAALVDQVLQEVEVDAAIFSETIAGNDGPLISPEMYEEFVLPHYEPVLEVLRRYGVETIIIRTYANTRVLLPSIMKWDFDCLWACETNPEAMDYHEIRREFGRDLRLIGGIDVDQLRQDKEAIRREVKERVPLLLNDGGYIPLADGRIRTDISYENYAAYRRILDGAVEKQRLSH
jgi:uroporphyrinogen decarboxylase